jgi:hypothetical protein
LWGLLIFELTNNQNMPIRDYTLEEIYIGDEVTFLSNSIDTDFPWVVTGKDERSNQVYIKPSPQVIKEDYWTFSVKNIMMVIQTSPLRKSPDQ